MNGKASLLFVDDNPRVIELLSLMFRDAYQVRTASSGSEALEIIDTHAVDVIVSDERMPGMRGVELLSEVQKRSPSTVRLLVAGYAELAALVGSIQTGDVFRFVNRPCNPDEIRRAVLEAVAASRSSAAEEHPNVDTTAPPASVRTSGVLVIDENADDRRAIANIIGDHFSVHSAASIPRAIELLVAHEIGVVVCEAQVGGMDVGKLFRVLKEDYPATSTVMVANPADFDRIVGLLDGAQIFRFASKPIRESVFELAVTAAMKEHQRLRAVALARHGDSDATSADDGRSVSIFGALLRSRTRQTRPEDPAG